MSQLTPIKSRSLRGKVGALLFSGLFALAFGAGGLWGGVSLAQTFGMAWSVRSWVPVEARVVAADLESRRGSKGGISYRVLVRYTYTWQGRAYESRRVGLTNDSDDVGDWQQRWHRELRASMDRGGSVQVWVDPREPSRAVIDKGIRWPVVVADVLFMGAGLGTGWVFVSLLLNRGLPFRFWKSTRPSARIKRFRMLASGIFWTLVGVPLSMVMWATHTPLVVKVFAATLVVVGVGLLWAGIRASRKARRRSDAADLSMAPSPAVAGSAVKLSFTLLPEALPSNAAAAGAMPRVHLRMAQYRNKSRTMSQRAEKLHQHVLPTRAANGTYRVTVSFDVPGDAVPLDRERVAWKLEVLDDDGAVDFDFDLDVVQRPSGPASVDR
jgi:Protein of unknown function (DUF3592)